MSQTSHTHDDISNRFAIIDAINVLEQAKCMMSYEYQTRYVMGTTSLVDDHKVRLLADAERYKIMTERLETELEKLRSRVK